MDLDRRALLVDVGGVRRAVYPFHAACGEREFGRGSDRSGKTDGDRLARQRGKERDHVERKRERNARFRGKRRGKLRADLANSRA